MIIATIAGRITKDAAMRQAGGASVCSFGVASNKKVKGVDATTFVDAQIWGSRGEKLCQYLTKGGFVVVSGEMSTREHNGKTYIQIDAQSVEFGPKAGGNKGAGRDDDAPAGAAPADESGGAGDDDALPF